MRLRTVLVVGAIVALCTASDALAQRGRGGFGRFGNTVYYMSLLQVDKIQEAVDLNDDQKEKIEAAREELAEARRAARGQGGGFQGFQDMSEEEQQEFIARIQERNAERAKTEKAKVAEILEDAQGKRLGEIFVQVAGADALSDADVAAALNIDDDLQAKLTAARDEAQATMFEAFGELQDLGPEERGEKIAELRAESDKTILAVLSAEQQEQFEGMKGEALELTLAEVNQARGRGGRGGGGGRRGGGGGRGRGGRGAQ